MVTEVEEGSPTPGAIRVVLTQFYLKNPPFYVTIKIMENVTHF
jgi:hypothetical protein